MNNYRIVRKEFLEFRDGVSIYKVVILADTADDVPPVEKEWAPFSLCYIAGSDCKVLNTQGVWVDV